MAGGFFRVVTASLALIAAQPAWADWHEASSDNFVIYADDKDTDLRRFAENLERYHSAMAFLTALKVEKPSPSNRVVIYAVGGQREIRKLSGGSRTVAGFYIPRAGGSRAFVQEIRNQKGYPHFSTIVMLHEYAHHFLISSSRFPMPRWMNEGAAEFFAAASFNDDGSLLIGRAAQHRGGELAFADPVHVRELIDPELYEKRKVKRYDAFYGKSWLLYHYLTFSKERAGQVGQYQTNLFNGMAPLAAGEAAFGDLDRLESEVADYLRGRRFLMVPLPADKLSVGPIALRKLPPGEAEMMPLIIRSQRGVNTEQAAKILDEARKVAGLYPDDAAVLAALAEAEYDAGNDRQAIDAADRAIAINPDTKNAYVQKGYALFRQAGKTEDKAAAYDAAMRPFEALNRLENDHPLPLIYYYRSFAERGATPPENARAALERASRLAPFDQTLQLNAGMMLIKEGKFAIAREFLAPVAANPHGGGAAERARKLIDMLAKTSLDMNINLGELTDEEDESASPEVAQ